MYRILYLYCEVMPYNVIAMEALLELNSELIIDVISWGDNKKLTPYCPPKNKRINYYSEFNFTYSQLLEFYLKSSYSLIYVCNRREKKYLKLAMFAKKMHNILIVGQTDEQLIPSIRQCIKKLLSYFLYRRYFDFMFATGLPQYEFLRFLGFKKKQILFGAYTANTELFNSNYLKNPEKKVSDQKVILFVGRLEEEKGIRILLNTIKRFSSDSLKLIMVGNGSLCIDVEDEVRVEYFKFMEQKKLLELLPTVDFFILPSTYEPWGVVIHEMAAAGLPILCSDCVGARWSFVINNYNGFVFKSNSISALYDCLFKAINLSEEKINLFKVRSFELSKSIKPELWAESINGLIYDK